MTKFDTRPDYSPKYRYCSKCSTMRSISYLVEVQEVARAKVYVCADDLSCGKRADRRKHRAIGGDKS